MTEQDQMLATAVVEAKIGTSQGITADIMRRTVIECIEDFCKRKEDHLAANAHLIAAAPDLLDALKHALGDVKARLYVMPANVRDIERAILEAQIVRYESAIAKAEGR